MFEDILNEQAVQGARQRNGFILTELFDAQTDLQDGETDQAYATLQRLTSVKPPQVQDVEVLDDFNRYLQIAQQTFDALKNGDEDKAELILSENL
jgi:hypothetical protein